MNRNNLEAYAQQARRDFIAAVTGRAAFYGLTAKSIEPVVEQGDVALIGARAFPRNVAVSRKRLEEQIRRDGFEQVMETMAYTWFNRFAAIRYMELHGYLDHGYRVLSHPEGQDQPEILEHPADVELPGLDREKAVELKLDGSKDEELYRLLLKAQCNALHQAMPFLFERIGDETELLLPANLLHTDSLIRQLVEGIDESAWGQIEIIGWLYQFYISEKKGQVIGKVVASEDIPAATQLFTPNWIVKYMVQNSLGAQWLATYPHSSIRGQMDYYIEPAEQSEEVTAQLAAITPGTLNPEALTLIDPASGSGHILVEAYDLFKAIYLERGYQKRGVAQLILEKNLFGLDIDGRAAQLTGFALMMKGRADDRRLFERDVKLNVMALVDSTGFDAERLAQSVKLGDYKLAASDLLELKRLFEHATTFGSLIQVPERMAAKLPGLKRLSETTSQDLYVVDALKRLAPLVQQAEMLAVQYDAVVANPPYMGSKGMNALVKKFAKDHFPDAKSDLFACFIKRGFTLAKDVGHNAMVTMQSWMFLSSFEKMRKWMLREKTIVTMAHMANGVMGIAFGTAATVLRNFTVSGYIADYSHTSVDDLSDQRVPSEFPVRNNRLKRVAQDEFKKIPGSPVAYWVTESMRAAFASFPRLDNFASPRKGMVTADNPRFIRCWHEVSASNTGHGFSRNSAAASQNKWFPYTKGGSFRRWAGNYVHVVNWDNDGHELLHMQEEGYKVGSTNHNLDFIFRPALTWTKITSSDSGFRVTPAGFLFDDASGVCPVIADGAEALVLALLNSPIAMHILRALNPTLNLYPGNLCTIPLDTRQRDKVAIDDCIKISMYDWNAYERSWDFESLPILTVSSEPTPTLESSYTAWVTQNRKTIAEMKRLEEENNRLFIDAYGLTRRTHPRCPHRANHPHGEPRLPLRRQAHRRGAVDPLPPEHHGRAGLLRYWLHYGPLQSGRAGPHLRPQRRTWVSTQAATPRSLPTQTASSHSPTPSGSTTMLPIASSSSSRWPGMRPVSKPTSSFWPITFRPRRTSPAARRCAATSATASSRTICRPTRSAPSTGCSRAASRRPSSASSTCTATTKARSPGCAPST